MSETKKKSRQELELLRDEALEAYLNREDFQYDLNGDALYRQYKDRYLDMGKNAMMDTMGQAAALTGGYGSSYAQNVGQQAYQKYLKELGNVVPELYQLAYDRYQDRGSAMYKTYEGWAKQAQEAAAYEQWQQEQARQQEQFRLEYEQAEQERLAQQQRWEQEQQASRQQWQKEFDEQKRQFDLQFGLSQQKAQSGGSGGRGGSSGGGFTGSAPRSDYYAWLSTYQGKGSRADANDPTAVTKYDNQNVSTGNIMAMQRALGLKDTGMWTKETQRAAGGLEADAAWDAYTKGKLQIRQSVGQGDMNISTGNIRTMERVLGLQEDGAWTAADQKAAGGLNEYEAWEAYQKGKLQLYR